MIYVMFEYVMNMLTILCWFPERDRATELKRPATESLWGGEISGSPSAGDARSSSSPTSVSWDLSVIQIFG